MISLQHFQDGAIGGTGANVTSRVDPASKSVCGYASVLHRPTRPFVAVHVLGRVLKQENVTLTIVQVCNQPVNFLQYSRYSGWFWWFNRPFAANGHMEQNPPC